MTKGVGIIDGQQIKPRRNVLDQPQIVDAYVLTGSEFSSAYIPGFLTISADGTYTATPTSISMTTNTYKPGTWGICQSTVASTEIGQFVIGGLTRLVDGEVVVSGNYVTGISLTGSVIASGTTASIVANSQVAMGLYSSSLSGMIIY